MKLILIGAEGDIGKAAHAELSARHEIITVGRSSGDIRADIADRASIDAMYEEAGTVDAVISAAVRLIGRVINMFSQELNRTVRGVVVAGELVPQRRSGIGHTQVAFALKCNCAVAGVDPDGSGS